MTQKIKRKHVNTGVIIMCVLGIIFYCYEYYLRVAPSVMSAPLKAVFRLDEAAFGYLAAFYYYAYTPMQIPVGMMMDRYGPRRILTFACLMCSVGTAVFAATNHLLIAQMGRFLVGFGSAFAYVGVLKISRTWLPKKYFALMAGICTTLGMFGAITGELVMMELVDVIGWRKTLYYSALVGFFLTIVLWSFLKEEIKRTEEVAEEPAHFAYKQLICFKEILFSSQMWINGLIGCFTFLPISGFAEIWAVRFLEDNGMLKEKAALGSSMIFLGFAVGGPLWGLLSDFMRSRRIPLMIGSFIAAVFMAIAIYFPCASALWMYPLLFFAAFFSSAEILVFAVSNDISRPSVSATAIAFTNMITMIGGALIPPVIGMLLDRSLRLVDGLPILTASDYATALSVIPASLVLAGILSFTLKESYHKG
jgi:MFS family permease